ncbi:MAG TPA: argininosuccinate lyase [Gemmatimonadales bacterium]|nr:argininosuccinate lyase [Gemmatimonadales bacterium]
MPEPSHVMWGGRFAEPMDPRLDRLNRSLPVDRRLWREDLATNRAWVCALERCRVLAAAERETLLAGLARVEAALAAGAADAAGDEDIHSLIERLLGETVGPVAGKLHTGRSRNDQMATDLRLWTVAALARLDAALASLARALIAQAERGMDALMPAYTHTQRAQPVRMAHWALAHVWPLARDRGRIGEARRRAAVLPLGSGAVAGSGFAVDRQRLAADLGFAEVSANSMDAVGDRDFAVEAVFAATLAGTHLSRLAEDLVLFSSAEFGFVKLGEAFTTGSSLMPQKRNPDALELVRGAAGQLLGRLVGLVATLKAMPTGYQKDLQENNAALFEALDLAEQAAALLAGVVETMTPDPARMAAALEPAVLATDLADLLVQGGMAFREAHGVVGALVRRAEELHVALDRVGAEEAARLSPALPAALAALGGPEAAVERRRLPGGTARDAVAAQLAAARAAVAS